MQRGEEENGFCSHRGMRMRMRRRAGQQEEMECSTNNSSGGGGRDRIGTHITHRIVLLPQCIFSSIRKSVAAAFAYTLVAQQQQDKA
jgi:hypothetical protein